MDISPEISRLIKKGIFSEQLREKQQKKKQQKLLKICCVIVCFLIFAIISFFIYHPACNSVLCSEPMLKQAQTAKTAKPQEKRGLIASSLSFFSQEEKTEEPVNVLLLGRAGQDYPGGNLTDTIILAYFNPAQKKAGLISLPRDLLVNAGTSKEEIWSKINTVNQTVGLEALKNIVEQITTLKIDHYAVIDLTVVKEIIETTGGLNVYVPQDINDPYFPGPNYSYDSFRLQKGWRYLDAATALKYIRTRYTSPNGDFDRMARQQQILHLLKQKVLSLNPLLDLNKYLKIYSTLNNHIQTDLSIWQIKDLWQIAKNVETDKIEHVVLDKKETGLLTSGSVMFGSQLASVVFPKAGIGQYEEIQKYIQEEIK